MKFLELSNGTLQPISRKALSLHIGMRYIQKTYYGEDGALPSCPKDARGMSSICRDSGYGFVQAAYSSVPNEVLLNPKATLAEVEGRLQNAAKELRDAGDTFVLTFSGHGMSVDIQFDGKRHEAWCLFDRPLFDTQLFALLADFEEKVTILVVSDSCWSGGIPLPPPPAFAFAMNDEAVDLEYSERFREIGPLKRLSESTIGFVTDRFQADYEATIKKYAGRRMRASVIHAVACGPDERTPSGNTAADYSLFSGNIVDIWDRGKFSGDFDQFETELRRETGPKPTPDIYAVHPVDPLFMKRGPFRF